MTKLLLRASGYKTFRWGNWRFQLYYPQIWLKKDDISLKLNISFRVSWGEYKAFAVACIFGAGFDYVVPEETTKET